MSERINAIDASRGLCLVNIFVNHITLGLLLEVSPSKIAFCDSADVFVLLAGISAFLAYGPRNGKFDLASASGRLWHRALTLYCANLAILAASFALFVLGGAGAPPPDPYVGPHELIAANGPLEYFWHVLTLQQSIGYSMVLRLYVVLMVVAPLYLWLASKRFWYPIPLAAAFWLVGGHFALVERDSLTGVLLSMTILPWQLVFAIGVSLGAAIVQGVKLPRSRALAAVSALVVIGGTGLMALGDQISPAVHDWLEMRNDHFWLGISKTLQSPLRLLYLVSLVYLAMAFAQAPVIRLLHQARPDSLFCRLGRRSLDVFVFGAVFAFAIDQLLWNLMTQGLIAHRTIAASILELALFALGLWAMARIADGKGIGRMRSPIAHPACQP